MTFALFGITCIAVCCRLGDWRNWRLCYPTILYLLIGDLTADFLLYGKPLFSFGGFIERYPVLDLSVMLLVYPVTVVLFLSHYPENPLRQALHILLWSGIYVAVELIAFHTDSYSHHNGWNIWHSVAFDLVMFPLLILHHKKPLLVWPISAALCFGLLWWFRIPFFMG